MEGLIFLIVLALIWIIFASVQDLKSREVSNWLNFSLIIFAIGFRFFYSLFNENFNFLYQGLIGLGIFFVLGNLLYYGRMFAGGDAKLFISLGVILAFSENFLINIKIFVLFILAFLFVGGFYGLIWSFVLSVKNSKNFKKEFPKQIKLNKTLLYTGIFIGIVLLLLGFFEISLFYLGILFFVFSYMYIYAKSVDECCMIKKIKPSQLTEGDWLYEDVKIGKKTIKAKWSGLSKDEIKLLKKKKFVVIRQGIPFVPVFLISFVLVVLAYHWIELWYSFW